MGLGQSDTKPDAGNVAKSKTVIVWGQNNLLGWSVDFFLSSQKDWRVINLSDKRGTDVLILEVENEHPDAVIVYQQACAKNMYLPVQLLQNYPGLTVISVNPDDNLMEVYNKRDIHIEEIGDFISGVNNNFKFNQQEDYKERDG